MAEQNGSSPNETDDGSSLLRDEPEWFESERNGGLFEKERNEMLTEDTTPWCIKLVKISSAGAIVVALPGAQNSESAEKGETGKRKVT